MALTIRTREGIGSTAANAVRRTGHVPGVLFGHGAAPLAIQVEARALSELLISGGRGQIVEATVDGAAESVLLRELQRDPISRRPLSADFQRVSTTESIVASVPIVAVGVPRGVRDQGGMMDTVTHALDVRGPAGRIPEQLEVDVSSLDVGQHIAAKDVPLPAGFALVTSPETIVISIEHGRTGTAPEGAGPEEPAPGTAPTGS